MAGGCYELTIIFIAPVWAWPSGYLDAPNAFVL